MRDSAAVDGVACSHCLVTPVQGNAMHHPIAKQVGTDSRVDGREARGRYIYWIGSALLQRITGNGREQARVAYRQVYG